MPYNGGTPPTITRPMDQWQWQPYTSLRHLDRPCPPARPCLTPPQGVRHGPWSLPPGCQHHRQAGGLKVFAAQPIQTGQDLGLNCQRAKVHRHVKAPLETFAVPPQRFDHVHVDLVRPLPPSQGYTYLFTVLAGSWRAP